MNAVADVPLDFAGEFVGVCRNDLSTPEAPCLPRPMLRCWYSESGVRATALNPNGWAAGIFQLMPDTARGLGWLPGDPRWTQVDAARARHKTAVERGDREGMHAAATEVSKLHEGIMREYTALSATEQLQWARRFYGSKRGSLTSAAACYVSTFLPAELEHAGNPGWVLCAAPGKHADYPQGKYAGAYADNRRAFDPEGKGWIEVRDMEARIDRVCVGPRWDALEHRLAAAECGPLPDLDLGTTLGVQCGLSRLGFDPGPTDGIEGPRTSAALRAFQTERGLEASGEVDEETRDALRAALESAA